MTTMKPLVLPQISINGSGRNELARQLSEVATALEGVLEAMQNANPHGRDYQHRPEEYQAARHAWVERFLAVSDMRHEMLEHASAIVEA